jgi:membrane associated rhomboid family serine protease
MVRFTRSPTVALLVVFGVVYLVQVTTAVLGLQVIFALSLPLDVRPWTLVTSVYAHGSLIHLASNAFALALVGLPLERSTTAVRFHLYFLLTGVCAGVAQVVVAGVFGTPVAVIGASGAIFALLGYLLAGNALSDTVFERVSPRIRAIIVVALAAVITLTTAAPGVALVAHFAGFVIGAVGGRGRILRTSQQATGIAES